MPTSAQAFRFEDRRPARQLKKQAFALLKAVRKVAASKRPYGRRYFWSTYEVRVPEWILSRAGIQPDDRVMVLPLEPGMIVVTKL